MQFKKFLTLLLAITAFSFAVKAQVTTGNIAGSVKAASDKVVLSGATIEALHEPTGTKYTAVARKDGRYTISSVDAGGPYTITASFVGFEKEVKKDVFVSLGETQTADFLLNSNVKSNQAVVVTGIRTAPASGKGGTETTIGADRLANAPSVGRNISDFVRFTPQAKLTSADGGISIAGQNNRYNSFFIDGAVNNDVFGLSASGTNGGQSGAPPISIDALDQFNVMLSPFDASIGNFTGGGINATTRSGTNTLKGSIYTYYRNEDLAGKTPGNVHDTLRKKLADFSTKTAGFRIGGPIIKNKLFFFVNAEIQRDIRPQPFSFSDYRGNTNSVAALNALRDTLKTRYNYDAGGFLDNPDRLNAERITGKIDWNVNKKNKFSISYRYSNSARDNTTASNSTNINYLNNGYLMPNVTNSLSAELRTNIKNGVSNKLLLTYTGVEDDRGALGSPFPRVTIFDGAGTIRFGTEEFSTANFLQQKNYNIIDFFKFVKNKHNFTVGGEFEYSKSNNVFIRQNYGSYQFTNLAAFYANQQATRYDRSFSLIDNGNGDKTDAAAKFNTSRLAAFINDDYKITDNLSLNLGVRVDYTNFLTKPKEDTFFNNKALPAISQYYDMKGARSGQISDASPSISPRLGVTYKIPEEQMTIRGGAGYFTGRIPLVWPGGVYNQNGVSLGGFTLTGASAPFFNPNPFGQMTGTPANKGQVDLIAKDFKMPKLFRTNLAFDKKLGKGWTTTLEGMYSKNINEIWYENVNILPSAVKSIGPGPRDVYAPTGGPNRILINGGANPYSGNVFLLSNNPNRKGFSYNLSLIVDKALSNGFSFNVGYTYGQSIVTNEGTSSQNNSQWRFMETVNGRNKVGLSTSDFDLGHRVIGYVSKKFTYANTEKTGWATIVSLVYNGQSGNPFSYVMQNAITGDNGRSEGNDLMYIPTASELSTGAFEFLANTVSGVTYTPAQQAAAFEQYISQNKYLSKRRGNFTERNGSRLPMTNTLDLKLQQEFSVKLGSKRYSMQVSYDIFNFTNMLNRDWGRMYFLANDNFQGVQFAGFKSVTAGNVDYLRPQYRFNPNLANTDPWGLSTSTAPSYSARWISQLGLRINF